MEKDVNKNRTKNVLRNICISTVILFLGIIMIIKSIMVEKGYSNVLYSYNISKNINYTIDLKQNDFFETQTLDMDKTYISSLVDKINMDFSYSFAGSKNANTKYNYQIVAVSNIRYSNVTKENEDIIWSKQYVITEPKKFEVNGSSFNIQDNFIVDYSLYNDEVLNFKEQLRLPVNADLQVKLIVRSDSDVKGIDEPVTECSIMNLKMDLAKDIFTVEKQFENVDNKKIENIVESKKTVNKPLLIIGCIFVLSAIMIMLDSIRKSIKFSKKSDYAIALNRILKNYGDIVAEIVSPVEIESLNIIEVKNFDQLLDIEEEIRMPILFYETIPDEQGEFIIVCDNVAYRYVIG